MCHIKPFKCTECEYACGTKTNLEHHMKSAHLDEKPHKCELCGDALGHVARENMTGVDK